MSIAPSDRTAFALGNGARVLHLHYPTSYGLCASFMRLQEFYESDIEGVRGRFFTLEEFMDAYAARMGNFTYTEDWGGFNVPGATWKEWRERFPEDSLLEKEKTLVAAVEELLGPAGATGDFYLIGSCAESSDLRGLVAHELAHALFALVPGYRKEMTDSVNAWKAAEPDAWGAMTAKLLKMGYMEGVLVDEVQAYFATSDDKDLARHFDFGAMPERARFQATFAQAVGANGIELPPPDLEEEASGDAPG